MKKKIIVISIGFFLCFIVYGCHKRRNSVRFITGKLPPNVLLKGDSAGYTGPDRYKVKATIFNQGSATLNYTNVFAIIKTEDGKNVGLTMANTNSTLKPRTSAKLVMETVITRDSGKPDLIVLYAE